MKALFQKSPRWVLVVLGLAAFGLLRSPFEDRMRVQLVESNLLLPPPAQDAVQQMSQSALMGTLGGLRTLVSSYLVLEAFGHFSNKEWEDLRRSYAVITSLEPRDENHWRDVVWHLGINATANMQIDESIPEFERKRRFNEYALLAVELAEQGIEQNPESTIIRKQLAEVYREKLRDFCAAARVYEELVDLPGSPQYSDRFVGYFLAKCPGREREAYDHLRKLYYEGEYNHKASLISDIKDLEKKFDILPALRIPDPYPDLPGGAQR
ncbi:MAG: hypothetical protein P1U58_02355 [Verrucomicrobiales bacterium]|nr:hypothetical protein [Verrucomicrobiales bacterium]